MVGKLSISRHLVSKRKQLGQENAIDLTKHFVILLGLWENDISRSPGLRGGTDDWFWREECEQKHMTLPDLVPNSKSPTQDPPLSYLLCHPGKALGADVLDAWVTFPLRATPGSFLTRKMCNGLHIKRKDQNNQTEYGLRGTEIVQGKDKDINLISSVFFLFRKNWGHIVLID